MILLIDLDAYHRQIVQHYLGKYFHEYIKSKNYDLNKVKILSALIYLNIPPLHGYPYNEVLFYYGKLNLIKLLKKS